MAEIAQWQLRPRWPSEQAFQALYRGIHGLGLSAPKTVACLRGLRSITQWSEVRARVDAARRLGAFEDDRAKRAKADGFCKIAPGALPGAEAAIQVCRDLSAATRDQQNQVYNSSGYGDAAFYREILTGLDFLRYPALVDFLTSEPLIRSIAGYLGGIPWLTQLILVRTSPNELEIGSQRFHFDHNDTRIVKFFVAVEDIDADTGPTAFLSLPDSETVKQKLGRAARKRMKDERIFAAVPRERLQVMTGPSGFSYMVDTCRCAHYGGRRNKRERLVMIANYNEVVVPRIGDEGETVSVRPVEIPGRTLTPLQQMVLRLDPR
jgi:hypothetical protein